MYCRICNSIKQDPKAQGTSKTSFPIRRDFFIHKAVKRPRVCDECRKEKESQRIMKIRQHYETLRLRIKIVSGDEVDDGRTT